MPIQVTEVARVTLPMAKARGFSAERQDAERRAGCPPDLAGVRMDGQPTCDWSGPRLLYPLAACPADRRAPPQALARRPPHTGSAPVRTAQVYRRGYLAARGHSSPCLKAGALWPQDG